MVEGDKQGKEKERIKFKIDCDIHYLSCKLPSDCEIIIKASSGKSFQKSTPPVLYSSSTSHAFFDAKLSGHITLQKSDSKFKKKSLKLQFFSKSSEIGKVVLEVSQIPNLKNPIKNREIPLTNHQDKLAVVSLSICLTAVESKSSKKQLKTVESKEQELESCETQVISSKMSFSEFIINPNEADLESESSSSEEEYKELPAERLSSFSTPKLDKELVTPNENSKSYMISEIEAKNGINPTRQKGNCVNCVVF